MTQSLFALRVSFVLDVYENNRCLILSGRVRACVRACNCDFGCARRDPTVRNFV